MRTNIFFLAILVALSAISCNRRAYVADNFEEKTADHLSIAVVPYDVVNTGRRTKRMTEEFMVQQRAWEAEAFQQDLVDRIMRRASRNRRLVVDMQATSQTNSLLEKAGIALVDAHTYTAQELTEILGVDAIVVAHIRKNKVLTEGESAAIAVATTILNVPDAGLNRTYEIDLRVTVLDRMGSMLYNDASFIDIDFSLTADQAISQVNRRLIRKFPYIEKR